MGLTTHTLGEICNKVGGIIRTGPFGSQLHESDYVDQGIPVVMPKNIIDGRVLIDDIAYIKESDAQRLAHHRLQEGDIVYGRRGDIGRRAFITKRELDWICGTGCLRISLGNKFLDSLFLYYYLGRPEVTSWIANHAIGATLPNLNTSIMRSVQITYPPLSIQRTIANILSAYDKLIENNTRRIAILEESAQMIYQEWFVKFSFPGYEQVEMVESELGTIPEGWEVVKMKDVTSIINRGISPKYDIASDSLVINQKCIRNGKLNLGEARRHITKLPEQKLVQFGDVLINSTGVGTLGRITQVYQAILNCTTDSHVTIVRPNNGVNLDFFGLQLLQQQHHFESLGIGSTGQTELGRESIANTLFLLPPQELQNDFADIVSAMRKSVIQMIEKNTVLRRTRDMLLPRLIAGEIDVSGWVEGDGEEAVQELAGSLVGTTRGYDEVGKVRRVAETSKVEPFKVDELEWHSLWE